VRALRESAALRPFQARAKVFIVAGAEMLTLPAADALLKTLEEPQAAVTIVLAATEADALPATVLSRCRLLSLQPVGQSAVAEALIERGTDAEEAERLARLARGSVGWALAAARTPKLAVEREELLERLSAVLELDLEARLLLAEDLAANRKDRSVVRRSLELLLLLARDLLLLSQGLSPRLVDGAARERLARQAARLSLSQIDAYLASIRTAMERIDRNVDPRLSLEALLTGAP
jgi:DNA polymerase-3 subunit delta'